MTKIYTLPAVTVDGRDTSIEIAVEDVEKLRAWLRDVRILEATSPFRFQWAMSPRATMHQCTGAFCVWCRDDGIYVKMMLHHENYFGRKYPLDELCRMLFNKSERPAFGWCITVKVC